VDVEDAVGRINDILDNYGEYRGRVDEWRQRVLVKEYRWDRVALMLAEIASQS
jgi:glycosyltransferase involved in cell wall biosynthesis